MRVSTIKNLINGLADDDEIYFIEYDDGNGYSYMAMTGAELRTEAGDDMLRNDHSEDEVNSRLACIEDTLEYLWKERGYTVLDL